MEVDRSVHAALLYNVYVLYKCFVRSSCMSGAPQKEQSKKGE